MVTVIKGMEFESVHYGLIERTKFDYDTKRMVPWANGEWNDEPDRAYWIDAETGLPCLIRRGPSGGLCGYVGVSKSHPWHGLDYSDSPIDVDVHGGLTYSDACQEDDRETGICHVSPDGDTAWWFGFDCAHSMDVMPGHESLFSEGRGSYRSLRYVRNQVESLAQQLAAVQS